MNRTEMMRMRAEMHGKAGGMTQYKVGDRVKIRADKAHDEDDAGMVGIVREIGTPALGVEMEKGEIHHWYVDSEVEPA